MSSHQDVGRVGQTPRRRRTAATQQQRIDRSTLHLHITYVTYNPSDTYGYGYKDIIFILDL